MAERDIPFNQLAKAGYNRGINRKHVNEIKNNFHEDMVQPAIVSFRDGKYYIIDHQHQSQAIYELNGRDPNTLIRCKVMTGLTYEEEADLYYRLNTGTRPLTFEDKIIGRIEAKDSTALEYQGVVESCGYVVGGRSARSLAAIKTTWGIFNKPDGANVLTQILTLTNDCWPNNNDGVSKQIIEGIYLFLQHHGDEYQRERFVAALSQTDPKDIVDSANAFYKRTYNRVYTHQYCTYNEIVSYYNYRLRAKKLVPFIPVS